MKNFTLFFACFILSIAVKANCTNAYSSASYALAHAKKAMSADNYDHQRYYAERALTAFEKTQAMTEECGCETSADYIYNGIDNLTKAADPKDWEMGRYYTKKALANAQDLLVALDLCTSGESSIIPDEAAPQYSESVEDLKNPEELEAQLALKRMAEITMFEYEKSVRELVKLLSCQEGLEFSQVLEQKSEDALQKETLEETKDFYRKQTVSLQLRALDAIKACSDPDSQDAAGRNSGN